MGICGSMTEVRGQRIVCKMTRLCSREWQWQLWQLKIRPYKRKKKFYIYISIYINIYRYIDIDDIFGCESPSKQLSQLSLSLLPRCRVVARTLPKCTECLDMIDIQWYKAVGEFRRKGRNGMDSGWGHLIFGHEGIHLGTKTLTNEVLMAWFGSVHVSAGEGERCWKEGCGGRFVAF